MSDATTKPVNQCDGCRAGYPRRWVDSGVLGHSGYFLHDYPEGVWHRMACQRERYEPGAAAQEDTK